jgi:hypothetical protein
MCASKLHVGGRMFCLYIPRVYPRSHDSSRLCHPPTYIAPPFYPSFLHHLPLLVETLPVSCYCLTSLFLFLFLSLSLSPRHEGILPILPFAIHDQILTVAAYTVLGIRHHQHKCPRIHPLLASTSIEAKPTNIGNSNQPTETT